MTVSTHTRIRQQAGMVSILVTLIMMLVISLIVLGFAQVSRREQRQALDRQLSEQAFYAAESGVNDARDKITQLQSQGLPIPEKSTCPTTTGDPNYNFNSTINTNNNVSYTCLLVTTKLNNLREDITAGDHSAMMPVEPGTGTITKLHLNWSAKTAQAVSDVAKCSPLSKVGTAGDFPTTDSGDWDCPYGLVRIDMVPTDNLDRTTLNNGQRTMFLYPTKSGAAATVNESTSRGAVAAMSCQAATNCDIDITNPTGGTNYAVRISSLYADGTATLTAFNGADQVELKNAQIQVDATGKAQDVLRRVQVRLPVTPPAKTPDFAIESGSSICKRYTIDPAAQFFRIPNDIKGQDQDNPMCRNLVVNPPCSQQNDIIMALDTSESMTAVWTLNPRTIRRTELVRVSNRFVDNTNVGALNQEGIIGFSGAVTVKQDFTQSIPTLHNFINSLPTVYGTNYGPALDAVTAMFDTDGRPTANKILVFISDGEDAGADAKDIAEAKAMQTTGITIYTIGINPTDAKLTTLKSMASTTSNFTNAVNVQQLDDVMQTIADSVKCGA